MSRMATQFRYFLLSATALSLVAYVHHSGLFTTYKQWDSQGYWLRPRTIYPTFLWSYIPGMTEIGKPVEYKASWEWANTIRKEGYRRPSWGALRSVGPKASLRTNLKPDLQYMTGSPSGGWNNQVIEVINAINIALKAGRIPVTNSFYAHASHLGATDDPASFTEVFDVSTLVDAWGGRPIVDATELKVDGSVADRHRRIVYDGEHPQRGPDGRKLKVGDVIEAEEPEQDHVRCWSTTMIKNGREYYETNIHEPISHEYTPFPADVYPGYCIHGTLASEYVANYTLPGDALPVGTIKRLAELNMTTSLSPTEQYSCLDRVFSLCLEPDGAGGPYNTGELDMWQSVGQYMKYQPGIQRIADDLLRHLFGLGWQEPLPPYLAVHARRGDMYPVIKAITQRQWSWRAREWLDKYEAERGVKIKHIVLATDEQDPVWLKELDLPGWYHLDHREVQTGDKLGYWWPTLIDSAVMSSASAFLGISSSTMSIMAANRVQGAGGAIEFIHNPNDKVPEDWSWVL